MAKEQGPLSGFRDLSADQMWARGAVLNVIVRTYELYGFMPLKTPAIERYETLNGKYGEEASVLMYDLKDHGDRHLALRYDHTVPLARVMAAQANSLPKPYKRYVVGDVWRGESPQAGRYREFTQIDADIVGSESYLADSETLAMMHDVFADLNVEVTIDVNDRRILDGLAEAGGIDNPKDFYRFIGVIDKVAKVGPEQVLDEINNVFGAKAQELVAKLLGISGKEGFDELLSIIDSPKVKAGVGNLKQIFQVLDDLGYEDIRFNPTIARGLNYYTSTIFETVLTKLSTLGSVCSGGRYDQLIEQLGGPETPAVGTSIGLDRLMEGLTQLGVAESMATKTEVYILNLDPSLDNARVGLAKNLRAAGIPTEIYYADTKLGKQLEAVSKLGVRKALIYGPKEHEKQVVVVRDLEGSSQQEVPLDKLVESLSKKQVGIF